MSDYEALNLASKERNRQQAIKLGLPGALSKCKSEIDSKKRRITTRYVMNWIPTCRNEEI